MFETSVPGVFAAGDVRANANRRIAAAVGEGSAAIFSAASVLAERVTARSRRPNPIIGPLNVCFATKVWFATSWLSLK